MKTISKLSLLSVFAVLLVSACAMTSRAYGRNTITANGKTVEKNYSKIFPDLSDIREIYLNGMADVRFTQGPRTSITAKGSSNVIEYLHIRQKGETLTFSEKGLQDKGINLREYDVVVYVTLPTLDKISLSGTGDFSFTNTFQGNRLELVLNGTGDISLPNFKLGDLNAVIGGTGDIKCSGTTVEATLSVKGTGDIDASIKGLSSVYASVYGTGDINLSGDTYSAKYTSYGTGDIYARKMIAHDVNASANGTGDITCYASDSFTGYNTTMTSITCYGNPQERNLKSDKYSFPSGSGNSARISPKTRENIRKQAEYARQQAEYARRQAEFARQQAEFARKQADFQRRQAEFERKKREAYDDSEMAIAMKTADQAIKRARKAGVKGELYTDINTNVNEVIIMDKNGKEVSRSYYTYPPKSKSSSYSSSSSSRSKSKSKTKSKTRKKTINGNEIVQTRTVVHDDGSVTTTYTDSKGNEYVEFTPAGE